MGRFLTIDIGAGTMDILSYDMESGMHFKAVVKSPALFLAEKAASLSGDLLITGVEMGGGTLSQILKERTREAEVVMSVSSAATIHHNLDRVRSLGIKVIEDEKADQLRQDKKYSLLDIGDLEIDRLERIIAGFGVPVAFDAVGICAQDHGVPPDGVSHLDYRHNIFKAILDDRPFPHTLLYRGDEVPATFNRLNAIALRAKLLPAKEVYVMDSGMAAIIGASRDPQARPKRRVLILDMATSHTIGAALEGEEIAGFFEYHTHDITLKRVEDLLIDLGNGKLRHKQILDQGGHGAYVRKALGFDGVEMILATGPKRGLIENTRLPIVLGAPLGDNMMTGTVGVLDAIRKRKGLKDIPYL